MARKTQFNRVRPGRQQWGWEPNETGSPGEGRAPRPGQGDIPPNPQAVNMADPKIEQLPLPGGPERVNSRPHDLSSAEKSRH
jgi:hypothetical protein